MTKPNHQPDEQFDQLPAALTAALREMDGPAALPDAERDARVLSGAREHLAHVHQTHQLHRKRRNLRLLFAGGAGGAIAAAVMIAFIIAGPFGKQDPSQDQTLASRDNQAESLDQPTEPTAQTARGDINRSGSVDILDAYTLARKIHRGQTTAELDLNDDGSVGQPDVDWITQRVVAIHSGERS